MAPLKYLLHMYCNKINLRAWNIRSDNYGTKGMKNVLFQHFLLGKAFDLHF